MLARFGDFFFLSKILWALVFSGFQIEFQLVLVIVGGLLCFFYLKLATVTLVESNVTCEGFFSTRCFKIFAHRLESRACGLSQSCVFYFEDQLLGESLGRDSDISACPSISRPGDKLTADKQKILCGGSAIAPSRKQAQHIPASKKEHHRLKSAGW